MFLKRNIISDLVVEQGHCPTTCVVQVVQGEKKYGEKIRTQNAIILDAPPIDFGKFVSHRILYF